MVDKGLLLALFETTLAHTDLETVYDDVRNTSYDIKGINQYIIGMDAVTELHLEPWQ